MKPTHAQLEEAKAYAHYSVKEGWSTEEDWENLTDEEYVLRALHDGDRGDMQAEVEAKEL